MLIGAAGVLTTLHAAPPTTAQPVPAPPVLAGAAGFAGFAPLTARPAPESLEIKHGGAGAAKPMRQRAALPVDVVAAGRLLTTSGHSVDLSGVGAVRQASRSGSGWLVVTGEPESTTRSLWRVQASGRQEALVDGADAFVLAADGSRAAWRAGGELVVARIAATGIVDPRRTPVPAAAAPVALIGDGVLVARTSAGGGIDGYDVWWPAQGPFAPTWAGGLTAIYGAMPDGRTLVAARNRPGGPDRMPQDGDLDGTYITAAQSGVCLVLLDTTDVFRQRTAACGLGLATGRAGRVSPDGRWLLAQSVTGSAILVDLAEAASGRGGTAVVGPGPVGDPVWLDAGTVVYGPSEGALVRLRVPVEGTGAATADTLALPDLSATLQALIAP